jgi:hypothetical protein
MMRLWLWVNVALVALLMEAVQVNAVQQVKACYTLKTGKTLTLTTDLDCSSYTEAGTVGVFMGTNSTLDCSGHAIIGPAISGGSDAYYGIYAVKKSKPKVKNCQVHGYVRGLYFDSVKNSTVTNSHFHDNTRYGASLVGKQSFNNVWDGNTFYNNGDEGIHISGPFNSTLAN